MGFADDTAVRGEGEGHFAATIHEGWDIAGNANGGYLLSIAARAMRASSGRPDPVSVTAHFVAPGHAGPAFVTTEVVKQGRTLATVSAWLESGGTRLLQADSVILCEEHGSDRNHAVSRYILDQTPLTLLVYDPHSHRLETVTELSILDRIKVSTNVGYNVFGAASAFWLDRIDALNAKAVRLQ